LELEEAALIDGANALAGFPPCGVANRTAGACGRVHPRRDLFLE